MTPSSPTETTLFRSADRRADGAGCFRELPVEVQSSAGHRGAGLLHGAQARLARYHGGMFRPAFGSLLLLALLGACEAPQSGTIATPLPGQQTERFPNGDLYVGQMAGGLREGQGTYTWSDGRRYAGSFRAGLEEGQGTYSYPNGKNMSASSRRTGAQARAPTAGRTGANMSASSATTGPTAAAPQLARRQEICRRVQARRRQRPGHLHLARRP